MGLCYIAISGPVALSFAGSGMSVMVASVSSRTLATETAFSKRDPDDLGRVDDAGFDQIDILLAAGIEAEIAFAFEHPRDHHAAVDRRVLGDLPGRRFERPLEDLTPVRSSPSH